MKFIVDKTTYYLVLLGDDGELVSDQFQEFSKETWPDTSEACCPLCSRRVHIDKIDVTLSAAYEREYGRRYIAGMWMCSQCEERKYGSFYVFDIVAK